MSKKNKDKSRGLRLIIKDNQLDQIHWNCFDRNTQLMVGITVNNEKVIAMEGRVGRYGRDDSSLGFLEINDCFTASEFLLKPVLQMVEEGTVKVRVFDEENWYEAMTWLHQNTYESVD